MGFDAGGAVFTAVANFSSLIAQSNQASRSLTQVGAAARGVGTAARQADPQLAGARRTLDQTAASAAKTSAAVEATGSASAATAGMSGRLRAAQLSVVAAQERYNTVLNSGGQATARLAAAEAGLLRAQERQTAVLADGSATEAQRATVTSAVATAQERYNALLAQGGVATGRLATAEAGLLRAQERLAATPPLSGGWRAGLVGALETAGKLGLSLGALELVIQAIDRIKIGAQFQRQMLMIQTNANASADEVRRMSGAVLSLAGQVGAAPTELATSLYHVEQNGLRSAKALDVVKIAAQGAQIGNADLEETTNSMTAAVVSGIPGVQNMAQAMGALITIVGTGDMKMSDLNEALGSGLLAVAKGYGLSLKDVGAALAVFGDNNIRGANAATALRQAIMAFAKPAVTAKKGFAEIGLSLDALGKDMQTGGLNKAVQDLNSHMVAAGITGNKVGAFLTDAFGKKAGVGLNILLQQIDRFNTKQEEIAAGAGSFAAKWDASTHTAAFAFKQLEAETEAAGIVVYDKLQPALYDVGRFLGVTLPAAASATQHALLPLEHELAGVLVPALKIAGAVLGLAAHGLEDVGEIAGRHTGTIQVLGTVVLGMWAAWKGYTIAQTAARGISAAFQTISTRAASARASMVGIATGAAPLSATSVALGGIGIALGIAAYAWQKHQAAVAANKAEIQSLTEAIQADSGALGENARAALAKEAADKGILAMARELGLNLGDLEDSMLGNSDATDRFYTALDKAGSSSTAAGKKAQKLAGALTDLNSEANSAAQNARDLQAAQAGGASTTEKATAAQVQLALSTAYIVDSGGNLVQVQGDVANAAAQTTSALQQQKTAADLLKDSWDALDGTAETAEQAQNAFLDSLDGLNDSVKQYGRSLDQNTSKGRKNREQIVQIIDAAKAQAQATADVVAATNGQTAGLIAGNAQLARNEAAILSHAGKLHLDRAQVQALITSLGQLSQIKPLTTPRVNPAPAKATLAELQARFADLTRQHTALVKVNDGAATPRLLAIEAELNRLNGKVATTYVNLVTRATGPGVIPGQRQNVATARADGGMLPGYTPGRDVHTFYSSTAGVLKLSGGEPVLRPEAGRVLGKGWVDGVNSAARSGGTSGVRRYLGGMADGGLLDGLARPSLAWSDMSGLVADTGGHVAARTTAAVSRPPRGQGRDDTGRHTTIENVNVFNPVPERTSESLPSALRNKVRVGV